MSDATPVGRQFLQKKLIFLNCWRNNMSAISLRLPNSIHSRVKNLAKFDGVSVNQFITVALT
jgi:predicted HicB family RNase H-like nuclease